MKNIDKLLYKCGIFYILSQNTSQFKKIAAVLDLTQKLQEKKEKEQASSSQETLMESVPLEAPEIIPTDPFSKKREEKFLSEVADVAGVWMHRFSNIRKDDKGFFILKSDNPAGKNMKKGHLLADYAINQTPYWEISSIEGERINLKPIGSNPFITGVGAGGAKITDKDIEVFTGQHEQERVKKIQEKVNNGTATIDDVKYILLGTCPLRFGPNATEGGWYSATDMMNNRGGRKGMSPEQIIKADAETLKKLGLKVPISALSGKLSPEDWKDWLSGKQDIEYLPKDIDKYLDFQKKMIEKREGRPADLDWIQSLRLKYDKKALEEYYDNLILELNQLGPEQFKIKYPEYKYFKNLSIKDFISLYESKLKDIKKKEEESEKFRTEEEESGDPLPSILRNVYSTEPRISMRNILLLIEMAKEDSTDTLNQYLRDIISQGGAKYYLANEKIINYFNSIDDIEGLKLASEKLTDSTNRRYASGYLIDKGEKDFVLSKVSPNESMEVLYGILSSNKYKEERKNTGNIRYPDTIQLAKNLDILNKIENIISRHEKECNTTGKYISYEEGHYIHEITGIILSCFDYLIRNLSSEEKQIFDRARAVSDRYQKLTENFKSN